MATRQIPCKFWAQNNCLKGASCPFKHGPGGGGGGFFQQQAAGGNRFAAFGQQQQQQQQQQPGRQQQQQQAGPLTPEQLRQLVVEDLQQRPPVWGVWSCYGADKYAATAHLEGGQDVQPEELRLQAYTASRQGPQALELYRRQVAAELQQRSAARQEAARQPDLLLARSTPSLLSGGSLLGGGGGLLSTPTTSIFGAASAFGSGPGLLPTPPAAAAIAPQPPAPVFGGVAPAVSLSPLTPAASLFGHQNAPFAAAPQLALGPDNTANVAVGAASSSLVADAAAEYAKARFTFRKIPETPPN